MAKKKVPKGKLGGKTVAIVGKFGYGRWTRNQLEEIVKFEGGEVVEGDKTAPDYVLAGAASGGSGVHSGAAKLQKKFPTTQVISETDFYQLTTPNADEFESILWDMNDDWAYWRSMGNRLERLNPKLDLSKRDFQTSIIENASLEHVILDGCDFRHSHLTGTNFGKIRNAKFDKAWLDRMSEAEDCSFKNADMENGGGGTYTRCNFNGADLSNFSGGNVTATDCTFVKAKMPGARFDDATFKNCDLSGANLAGANLTRANFTDAKFAGANFTKADLREANLTNADLRKANLKDAVLSGAVLTGAKLDGADFTGANLSGVDLTGVNIAKAKNLEARTRPPVGPNLKQLGAAVRKSKDFTTTIELSLGKNEKVTLQPSSHTYGPSAYSYARYEHETPAEVEHSSLSTGTTTFEDAMIDLADRWFRGTPKFDSITVESKKCPMKGEELQKLVYLAWHEALGVAVPTESELEKQQEQLATGLETLRAKMFAELRGGEKGIAKWNKRSDADRKKIGSLRDADFSKAKMTGAHLNNLDLQGAKFDGATLAKVGFSNTQLQKASFAKAKLTNANLRVCKCQGASFEGASLGGVDLSYASLQKANFRDANLKKTDFDSADLCGADFTGATLEKTDFGDAKFDNDTKFPTGFKPPTSMTWKGTGARPGLTVAKAAAPGSMDFPTFLKNLEKKVDASRMKKAGSMLKAARFELYADVTDTGLVGIVKSQTDKDLVYSCRLANTGAFGCGTQNLKPCGGLGGALCKHLLVLIVGLTKGGKVDPALASAWADASKAHKPTFDKDAMSETFLKYKGAEAGDIDWRPTETVPEDFYAM